MADDGSSYGHPPNDTLFPCRSAAAHPYSDAKQLGQQTAQREITIALENALDARRQRIIISQSEVNWVKWSCLCLLAACALVAIAMVHSDNRLTSAITMAPFASGVAASLLLILAHDRPFIGELSVGPNALFQVMPAATIQSASDEALTP
jgi:hypothetical protein